MTFAELLYKDMQWGEGAEAGIMTNDISSSVTLPGSGTQGIEQLTQLSNVGQPGVWLFRVDEPTIQPCPLAGQQPPYCQKKTRPTDRILTSRPPQKIRPPVVSHDADPHVEGVSVVGVPVGAPRTIQPQLETIRTHNTIGNTQLEISVTTAPIFPERTTPPKTTRPRPRYESTPHRPIVSLGDNDFEELEPDVFEITFPPFVTVIPEVFTSKPKQLPDFTVQESSTITTRALTTTEATFPTFKLSDAEETLVTVAPVKAQPQTTMKQKTPSVEETFGTGEPLKEEDLFEVRIEPEMMPTLTKEHTGVQNLEKTGTMTKVPEVHTTEEVPEVPERHLTTPSTTGAQIFVFTTTKATTRVTQRRPNIVTAGTTTTVEPEEDREAAASKMAIIIPSVIVVVWIMLLIAIALFVCCRRSLSLNITISRSSSAQLRPYGPVYSVQPTAYALKRNGKHVEGSYEDHMEKAARLSNEMNAYSQVFLQMMEK
ncbi:Nidogen-like protein [Necator americanus]|uniref:Nidogen-like protein n=1 Tax=Necator americanus TaxID=51031 RepID=W2TVT6_NECAM|nr:Nidogen-like protein [Necator americanus]ETN85933.1 Nidogen-like protein [Necator americanus]